MAYPLYRCTRPSRCSRSTGLEGRFQGTTACAYVWKSSPSCPTDVEANTSGQNGDVNACREAPSRLSDPSLEDTPPNLAATWVRRLGVATDAPASSTRMSATRAAAVASVVTSASRAANASHRSSGWADASPLDSVRTCTYSSSTAWRLPSLA